MAELNAMKAIKENVGKINNRYDIGVKQIKDILANCKGEYDVIYNFFAIGYIQGQKAAKAEMRKVGK